MCRLLLSSLTIVLCRCALDGAALQIDPEDIEDQKTNPERKKLKLKEVHLTKLLSTKVRGTEFTPCPLDARHTIVTLKSSNICASA